MRPSGGSSFTNPGAGCGGIAAPGPAAGGAAVAEDAGMDGGRGADGRLGDRRDDGDFQHCEHGAAAAFAVSASPAALCSGRNEQVHGGPGAGLLCVFRKNRHGSAGSSIQEMGAYDSGGVNWTGATGAERLVAGDWSQRRFSPRCRSNPCTVERLFRRKTGPAGTKSWLC